MRRIVGEHAVGKGHASGVSVRYVEAGDVVCDDPRAGPRERWCPIRTKHRDRIARIPAACIPSFGGKDTRKQRDTQCERTESSHSDPPWSFQTFMSRQSHASAMQNGIVLFMSPPDGSSVDGCRTPADAATAVLATRRCWARNR